MNNKILISVLCLLIGFTAGMFFYKKGTEKMEVIPKETVSLNQQSTNITNKLFNFLDSLKMNDNADMGHSRINIIKENLGLMVIEYPTSQESKEYSVYDYKNDILYGKIGYGSLGNSTIPIEFVNETSVLMETDDDATINRSLSVKDFKHNTEKYLSLKLDQSVQVEASLSKQILTIFLSGKNKTDIYNLDTTTLDLKKVK